MPHLEPAQAAFTVCAQSPAVAAVTLERMKSWRWASLCVLVGAGCGGGGDEPSGEKPGQGDPQGAALTYHRDARPILEAKCAHCHEPGNIAPFALTNFAETFELRAAIAAAVRSGSMPPWQPADGCQEYNGDFSLTDEERETLLAWVDAGAPEGNPADYQAVGGATGAFEADRALGLAEPYTPTESPDDYRCFLVEWPETTAKFVTGIRVAPDRLDMVHHVITYVATPDQVADFRALDAAEEGPGYTCFGGPGQGGGKRPYQLGAWVPGVPGGAYPEGTGIAVDPGSLLVVQMHYNTLTSAPGPDQSHVEVTLADQVERPALTFLAVVPRWLKAGGMTLPAGEAEVVHSSDIDVTRLFPFLGGSRIGLGAGDPFVIHGVGFHMHQLGTRGRTSIIRKDGKEECLLDIPHWDFNWQGGYQLAHEVRVEPGDKLRIHCTWDNSAKNQPFVDGAQLEPRDVGWGEGTRDEMCLSGLFVTAQ